MKNQTKGKGEKMKEKLKQVSIYCSIILVIIIEQIIKYFVEANIENLPKKVINNFLDISYCKNTGIAFGFGTGNVIIFVICNIVILGLIAKFIISQKQRLDSKNKFVLSLIIAGGTSNLIDRIFRGYVVDYIDITPLIKFPIFNMADILICVGSIGFAIEVFKYIKYKDKNE